MIFGAGGYLGTRVAARAAALGHEVVGTATTTAGGWLAVDLRSRAAVLALIAEVRPQAVINVAARMDDWQVCADGAGHVAVGAVEAGARLVHMSSDVVHGGRPEPYVESDLPAPLGRYGASKAAGETAVVAIDPGAAVVRTSLIIGTDDSQHIRMSYDMITGRRPGVLFTDEIRCPVHVDDLAAATVELAGTDYAGVLNVAGPEAITRADLGRLVARRYGLDPAAVPTGSLAEAKLGPRAAEIRLDVARARQVLTTTRLRPVAESVQPG